MNTQLPQCIPATLHCTPIEPCPTINPPCHHAPPNTYVAATSCPPATVCPQPTTLCPPLGPTGVQHCTAAPAVCGHTSWGCPPPPQAGPGLVGPTGVWHCTAAPALCGNTSWPGCMIGPTGWHGCPPPVPQAAPQHAPQQQLGVGQSPVGPTGVYHCTSAPATCGHTSWHGCPLGQTGVYHCTSTPAACGHTSWPGCAGTAATICTQFHC